MLKNISMILSLSSLVLISQFAEAATPDRKQSSLKSSYAQVDNGNSVNSVINIQRLQEQSTRSQEVERRERRENERIRLVALELTSKRDYVGLGNLFFSSGRGDEAIGAYTKAIEVNSKDADSYFQRARAKSYYLKDLRGAIADYDIVIAIYPLSDGAYRNRALAKYDLNDRSGSLQDFRSAAKIQKERGDVETFKDTIDRIQYFFKVPE
jgi:tetratricopeptide (TPR) repeat protein